MRYYSDRFLFDTLQGAGQTFKQRMTQNREPYSRKDFGC